VIDSFDAFKKDNPHADDAKWAEFDGDGHTAIYKPSKGAIKLLKAYKRAADARFFNNGYSKNLTFARWQQARTDMLG